MFLLCTLWLRNAIPRYPCVRYPSGRVFNVANNMNTESSLITFENAIKLRKEKTLSLIHHSDRGVKYCDNDCKNYSRKALQNVA